MNEFILEENVDKLKSAILNLIYLKPEERLVTPNIINLDDIKECLNCIFVENSCTDVLFTNNTDKPFFGIHVNPLMSSTDAITIIATDEKVKLNKYQIEFDSKLFTLDLSAEEIARKAMKIAADLCIYTNHSIILEKIEEKNDIVNA